MWNLKKAGRKIIYGVGTIATVAIVGVVLFFIYIKVFNSESANISFNDGPYIFYLNDSTIKSVVVRDDPEKDFIIYENEISRNDALEMDWEKENLFSEFNPFERISDSDEAVYEADKIAAVSDVHGSFFHFRALLNAQGVIDDMWNWNWGNGHLVIVGDVFDKGPNVTECFWLLRKLEIQAEQQGGKVHLLLGNHEGLIFNGVNEYVDGKYRAICDKLVISYHRLYGPNTYLGRWLRTKNVCVKINNNLFVHGGVSKQLLDAGLSVSEINRFAKTWINSEHLIGNEPETRNHIRLIKSGPGPLEYRGYFNRNIINRGQSGLSGEIIAKALNHFNVEHIVVGHTIVKHIKGLFDNRVIAIDKKFPEDDILNPKSECEMLIVEGTDYYRAQLNGERILLFLENQARAN